MRRTKIVILSLLIPCATFAQPAPDATGTGPNDTTTAEYKFDAAIDPDILADRSTELWARVYRPANLTSAAPLLVFLHGNHATCGMGVNPRRDTDCTYTTSGTCPGGFVVVPNHEGYGYIADRLASWGYVVVSINANRGITCGAGIVGDAGLNLARGRLVLKHLQKLSDWNAGREATPVSLGVDLTGLIDFSNVALLGHSRGGEGVRAAYNLYLDTGSPWPARIGPVTFRAMFEIAPVDRQTSRILNADGIPWNTLLPMCDGDVSNLAGLGPFDRMLANRSEAPATQKSTFTVWGANHNFFNTEWQESDSPGCLRHTPIFPASPGSPQQQQVGRAAVMALMRANVQGATGMDPTFNQNFDPLHGLPAVITDVTRVDRGFTDSPDRAVTERLDDFNNSEPLSSWLVPNDTSGLASYGHGGMPGHDSSIQKAAVVSWESPGPGVYFQPNWTSAGSGRDLSLYRTLEFRVDRADNSLNPPEGTNFSIAVGFDDGSLSSSVLLSSYASLVGPVGGAIGGLHLVLQTVRIPLADFGLSPADQARVRGLRFTFDQTPTGILFLCNVRVSTGSGSGAIEPGDPPALMALSNAQFNTSGADVIVHDPINAGNQVAVRTEKGTGVSQPPDDSVDILLWSNQAFPVRDELAVLSVGDQQLNLSKYEGPGTNTLVFTIRRAEYDQLQPGASVRVQYGGNAFERWEFGPLNK